MRRYESMWRYSDLDLYSLRRTHFWCDAVDQIRLVQQYDDLQYVHLILLRIFDEQIYWCGVVCEIRMGIHMYAIVVFFLVGLPLLLCAWCGDTNSSRD